MNRTARRVGSAAVLLCAAMGFVSCGTVPAGRVGLEEARRLAADPATFILDVRTREEFASGSIERAALIPIRELPKRTAELPADKATPILVYCQSGWRSAVAADRLRKAGHTSVHDFGGGMAAWRAARLPVVVNGGMSAQ